MSASPAVATPASPASPSRRRRVIIDTDGGCDDAIAILMALRDENTEVVAMTSVFGNVKQEQATENIYTILRVFDELSIPFYRGASQPLVSDRHIETWPGHGANGLGDASFLEGGAHHDHDAYQKRVEEAIGKKHAAQALIDYSLQFPNELDLIALGPLTNLALAIRLDPGFVKRWRSLTIMGGSANGKGNATMGVEFNFMCDPEGAYVTLAHFPSATCPVTIVPWEATEGASLTWQQFDELTRGHEDHIFGDARTRHALEASFLKKTHAKYELVCRTDIGVAPPSKKAKTDATDAGATGSLLTPDQSSALNELPSIADLQRAQASEAAAGHSATVGVQSALATASDPAEYVCCDSYAVAALLRPEIMSRVSSHGVEVVTQGTAESRGLLLVDWYNKKKELVNKKVNIVTAINKQVYISMMNDIFQPTAAATAAAAAGHAKKRK